MQLSRKDFQTILAGLTDAIQSRLSQNDELTNHLMILANNDIIEHYEDVLKKVNDLYNETYSR